MARSQRTQAALAREVGMKQQALSRRLSAQTPFTIDELARIADAMQISLNDLIGVGAA